MAATINDVEPSLPRDCALVAWTLAPRRLRSSAIGADVRIASAPAKLSSVVPRTRATIEFPRSDRLDGREQTRPLATSRWSGARAFEPIVSARN
jgi:hypothetical protein